MRAFRYIVLAAWAVSASSNLTAEDCAHAADRLRADSDRERAWGAYRAASCQMPELATEIAAQLRKMSPDMSGRTIWGEPQWAVKAMLDALIHLRQPLDDDAWEWMIPRFPTEAMILMLQDAPRNQAQLWKVREMAVPNAVWIAASNELARMRAPGFTAALLREVRPTIFVYVKDPGGHFRGSVGSSFTGSSNRRVPAGYPPVTLYWLSQQRTSESDTAVDGKPPVYLNFALINERNSDVPHPSDSICVSCEKNCPDCQAERIAYLAEFARLPSKEVEPIVRPRLLLDFHTPQQIDTEIWRAISAQQTGMKKIVEQLEGLGVIEHSPDLGAAPFAIHIDDQRADRSVPLPQYRVDYRQ